MFQINNNLIVTSTNPIPLKLGLDEMKQTRFAFSADFEHELKSGKRVQTCDCSTDFDANTLK